MKNKLLFLSAFLFSGVLFSGCSKDDDEVVAKTNYFSISDQEYDLNTGFLEDYGVDGDGFNLDLTLHTSSLVVLEEDGEFFDFEGIGNVMYFEIFTSLEGDLAEGSYTFNESYAPGTFDIGYVGVNYNSDLGTGTVFDVEAGNITVSKSGGTYTIGLNLTLDDGQTLVGSYTGSLGYYDYDFFAVAGNASSRLAKPSKGFKVK